MVYFISIDNIVCPSSHTFLESKIATIKEIFNRIILVKSPHDVHLALAPDEKYEPGVNKEDVYEFVVGGWANTKSFIRRGNQGRELATAEVIQAFQNQF